MKKTISKLKEKRIFNRTTLLLFTFVFASLGAYALIRTPAATIPQVSAGKATPGVPVPTRGAYFGGINKENIPSTYSIQTTPGCTDTSSQWKLLECKIAWAGRQQGLNVPLNYAMSMEHFFTSCTSSNGLFTTGGDIYKSSQTIGRKIMFINMKCSDWPTLASGSGAAYQSAESSIREKVRLMSNLAVPVIFVYNHEPENDGGQADYYRAAFRRVSYIVRDEQIKINKNRISIGWAPMGCTFEGLKLDGSLSGERRDCPTYFPEHWYPGDDAVDWVMAQPYNKYGCTNKSNLDDCNTFDDVIEDFYNWANAPCPKINIPVGNYNCTSARQSKPLGIGEYGIGSNYDEVIVSKRVEFYERNRVTAPTKYPRIKMWAYWSSQVSDRPFRYVVDWPVDANRTNLKGFARLALDPYFNNLEFSSNPPPPPPPDPTTIDIIYPKNNSIVSGIVNVDVGPDTGYEEVSFRVNGEWQFNDSSAPFTWNWDTTTYPNGINSLIIRARKIGDPGGTYTEKSVSVNVQNIPTIKTGDLNNDTKIDVLDLSILLSNWDPTASKPKSIADINNDTKVDVLDLSALLSNWGK